MPENLPWVRYPIDDLWSARTMEPCPSSFDWEHLEKVQHIHEQWLKRLYGPRALPLDDLRNRRDYAAMIDASRLSG